MKQELLYEDFAKYYDLIYNYKDYKKEAEWLDKIIREKIGDNKKVLLDVACGTGNHIKYLNELGYNCEGIDKSKQMLEIAKEKLPALNFYQQDMLSNFSPGKYDIIISMFSSIAYILTYENFRRFIDNMNILLEPGGIVIMQPWFESGKFTAGIPYSKIYDNGMSMVRMSASKIEGILSIMEYHYLIYDNGKIKHFTDLHEMALFNVEKLMEIMEEKKLKTEFIPPHNDNGRGLIIGIKQKE